MYRSDPVQRTNQNRCRFDNLNLDFNFFLFRNPFRNVFASSSAAYCIFEHRRKDYCCFTSHLLHSNLLVQSTRFPGTAGMPVPIPGYPEPPDILHPRRRTACGQFLVCYRTFAHQNTNPADQELQSRGGHQGLSGYSI